MSSTLSLTLVLFARRRTSIFEFVGQLREGRPEAWIALGVLLSCVAFFALYEKITGRPFVKSREERRAARRRRKHVIWEYKRDA